MVFNWKTTLAGAFVIAAAATETLLGIDIPGFNVDLAGALALGAGLLFAADKR